MFLTVTCNRSLNILHNAKSDTRAHEPSITDTHDTNTIATEQPFETTFSNTYSNDTIVPTLKTTFAIAH